ncbi:MAG: proline dehydrogenase family protein [Ignavibacteriales bacterium]|nr:proline dehydrogenase family protein [Ignavibacteriales bacterium]
MGLARSALLWISENRTLREKLPRYRFIRRAVNRFMPGEELDDALAAASALKQDRINTIFTRLGENVLDEHTAREVADHYVDASRKISNLGVDAYLSVKLTQLGLDLGEDLCVGNLERIIQAAEEAKTWVWIDMEQSPYVDRTLRIYRRMRERHKKVGVCLQSYLRRTERDLAELLPLSPGIRLVKGAYKEPPDVAFTRKAEVDANYLTLSKTMLDAAANGVFFGVATHDQSLIDRINEESRRRGLDKSRYELQLLYGIRTDVQRRLAAEGYSVRCLISYGSYWFPWYVRRLAERPANVWFVLKNLFA